MKTDRRKVTRDQYLAEAAERFGSDPMNWRFVCPVCGHIASTRDYKDAGAPDSAVAFSCVGRWLPGSKDAFESSGHGPCTYAGAGLFRLNPVNVDGWHEAGYFELAPAVEVPA